MENGSTSVPGERPSLLVGGMAAILASTCCLGPLVLVTLGFSGAWIGNLTVLEPYQPIFIGVALISLYFAWRRLRRNAIACALGAACAAPGVRQVHKVLFAMIASLTVVALVFPYMAPWFY